MEDNEIELVRTDLVEFILEEGLSLYYNKNEEVWLIEYIDQETGEDFSEYLDLHKDFPQALKGYILSDEEFQVYKDIVEKEIKL